MYEHISGLTVRISMHISTEKKEKGLRADSRAYPQHTEIRGKRNQEKRPSNRNQGVVRPKENPNEAKISMRVGKMLLKSYGENGPLDWMTCR